MKDSSYPFAKGKMYYIRIAGAVAAVVGLIWFCTNQPGQSTQDSGPTRTPRPIPTRTVRPTEVVFSQGQLTSTAAAVIAHEGAVRFMTYNIQSGGGERLPVLTSIMKTYNADILAIQEANDWDENEFATLTQVATELEMESVYCKAAPDANGKEEDLVLLSKFKIVDSETYSGVSHCFLRAEVEIAQGKTIQVFATHITPNFAEVGCENVQKIADIVKPFVGEEAAIIGDFNLPPPTVKMGYPSEQIACPPILQDAGWKYLGAVSDVAQMWVTESMKAVKYAQLPGPSKGVLVPRNTITTASGHLPLAIDFYFP